MIAYVKGILEDTTIDQAIIDVNGIGYAVYTSFSTLERLPVKGDLIKLYTYTYVREDAFQLFGFLSKDELALFKQLISVNGIGPKGGLAILSTLSADDLRFAIMSGDSKAISKAPGIGAKTAQRVILDLKDKIDFKDSADDLSLGNSFASPSADNGINSIRNDAMEALVNLGYSQTEVMRALSGISISEDLTVEELIKATLKKLFG